MSVKNLKFPKKTKFEVVRKKPVKKTIRSKRKMSKRGRHKKSDDRDRRRMKMDLKTPLEKAVHTNDTKSIEALLRKEWDAILPFHPNEEVDEYARQYRLKQIRGRTGLTESHSVLHFAVFRGYLDVVKMLIKNDADVNAVQKENEDTALHIVCRHGHVDVLKFLIQNGADVNAVNKSENAPLFYAALGNYAEAAKVLLQNGADVNAGGLNGWTALHVAAKFDGCADVAKVLIQNGADVNAVDEFEGAMPHHLASEVGHHDILKLLLHNGADVNAVDSEEHTALQRAARYCRSRCVLELLCFGAEINESAIKCDVTRRLEPINNRLISLRGGNGMETTLMSEEEKRFMWNLAFFFTIKHRVAAFKAYYAIRSFITFHGIFMASGYDRGKYLNIWYIYEDDEEYTPWFSPEEFQALIDRNAVLSARLERLASLRSYEKRVEQICSRYG